jgi:hypothetical protein
MENNPYLKKLELLQNAKKKWDESEWYLSFLRSEGEAPKRNQEDLLLWFKTCQSAT